MEIFVTLQETLRKLWKFEVLKMRQKLDANMEGFRWASHICKEMLLIINFAIINVAHIIILTMFEFVSK